MTGETAPGEGSTMPPRRHRRRRWLIGGAVALLVLLLAAAVAASWKFSSDLLVPDHSGGPYDVEVREVAPGRVVFPRTEETERPGLYGLTWKGGRAQVRRVLASDDDTVTRELRPVSGRLEPGTDTNLQSTYYSGSPRQALGVPYTRVSVPGELGPMPAWKIDGRGSTWAIFVHGINSSPESGLRLVPTLRRADLPSLLITYRDDVGAPKSPDGLHHLGMTEWRDVDAAARYAVAHGARRLVLVAYSMGGALVTQFMERSKLAPRVTGMVLDAPALSWKPILSFNATQKGFPSFASLPVEWMVAARIDVDWDRLDALRHTDQLRVPTLLFHGTEDDVVPISLSDDYAAKLPGTVTYFRTPQAGHVESWNVNRAVYEARLRSFLAKIGASAPVAR